MCNTHVYCTLLLRISLSSYMVVKHLNLLNDSAWHIVVCNNCLVNASQSIALYHVRMYPVVEIRIRKWLTVY